MQAVKLDLTQYIPGSQENRSGPKLILSLKPFIDFLRERAGQEKTGKKNVFNYVLQELAAFPELQQPVAEEKIGSYAHIFELIHHLVSPLLHKEENQLWAISKPVSPCFYFGSDSFYAVMMDEKKEHLNEMMTLPSSAEMERKILGNFYNLVLQEFYQFSLNSQPHLVQSIMDRETKLIRYYRLDVDSRFISISASKTLPELSIDQIKSLLDREQDHLTILQEILPASLFTIAGMSIVTLTDATPEYALESIKSVIIAHQTCAAGCDLKSFRQALCSLVGSNQVEFSLIPFIKLNEKLLLYDQDGFYSIMLSVAKEAGWSATDEEQTISSFLEQPKRFIIPVITEEIEESMPIMALLKKQGIQSIALYPLYSSGKLVGALEMYSRTPYAMTPGILSAVESAFPLLAQLYQNLIIDFNNEISTIITDQFTAIQPAVQWRFVEAAYNYLQSGDLARNLPIEPVDFKDVYPFYGAIDVRNSSVQRNQMIRKDLFAHFQLLEQALEKLKPERCAAIQEGVSQKIKNWNLEHFTELSHTEVFKTDDYLRRQLPKQLEILKTTYPEIGGLIDDYLEKSKPGGIVFRHRDQYELSMQMINHALSRELDQFNRELQEIYPCYFEKFRTDGVEFDIYLGQTIAPAIPFHDGLVGIFRYLQLKVIARIARVTAGLYSHLPLQLETTQLIFVYGRTLDISFRRDEQRFDVEGSYNIRYQMVKKRIDKALIKGSTERLTQPGKIAIVYFNQPEAQEYLQHIRRLQTENLLSTEIEYLELEELQGVEGLKALRVAILPELNLLNSIVHDT